MSTSLSPTITSTGIGSGLDIETLVTKLMSIERQPITQLATQTTKLQTQLSEYGKVQAAFAAMRDASNKLTNTDTWAANNATSSDASAVSVTTGTAATAGSVAVSVSQLASSQTITSAVMPASPGTVGQGSITIELGQWSSDQSGFTPKADATAVTIDIGSGEDQLSQIRDKINAARAGVVASIVTDSTGQRLVMRSSATGEENGFRVSATEVAPADGTTATGPGLSSLAFDPSTGVGAMTQKLPAANAHAMINGIEIDSATNTLTGTLDGLNITLLKTTSSDVTLTVAADTTSIKKAINDFATAYNALATMLKADTKYDESAKSAGSLQGDSTAVNLQSQLRSLASTSTTLGGSFSRLADIGLNPVAGGTLTVDDTKLTSALGQLSDLKQFFMGLDSTDANNSGFAQKFKSLGDTALSIDGSLSTKQTGLQARISDNGKRSSQMEDHASLTEARMRARYTALDTQMSKLSSLSTYVSQQMALLAKSSSS
jgi:flagellar hook-associated protein 2